jgi:hypothetical protein
MYTYTAGSPYNFRINKALDTETAAVALILESAVKNNDYSVIEFVYDPDDVAEIESSNGKLLTKAQLTKLKAGNKKAWVEYIKDWWLRDILSTIQKKDFVTPDTLNGRSEKEYRRFAKRLINYIIDVSKNSALTPTTYILTKGDDIEMEVTGTMQKKFAAVIMLLTKALEDGDFYMFDFYYTENEKGNRRKIPESKRAYLREGEKMGWVYYIVNWWVTDSFLKRIIREEKRSRK